MVCDQDGDGTSDRVFTDGANPRYVKGLCMATPINLSATTVAQCYGADAAGLVQYGDETDDFCTVQGFPFDDHFGDLMDGGDTTDDLNALRMPKISYWRQCNGAVDSALDPDNPGTDVVNDIYNCVDVDKNDQAWENPFDVAKGHRGFMYGDFIMAMYAWSPNWKDNAAGKDNYNLYVRRSFNGGDTWTTLPATDSDFLPAMATMADVVAGGSKHCEWYQPDPETSDLTANSGEDPVCFTYAAGEFEQARNLSQLTGIHYTVLDPRFASSDPSFLGDIVLRTDNTVDGVMVAGEPLYPDDDLVNPSRFFATFEEGDTSEIAEGGEGVPMDMYYARAINFGDLYEVGDTLLEDLGGDADGDGSNADIVPYFADNEWQFEIFDQLECTESHAAEASLKASPGGTFFYATWNQWKETDDGTVYDSDAIVRRSMELDGDETGEFAPSGESLALPDVTYPSFGCGDSGGDGDGGGGGNGKPKKPRK
jgi:hypothetical protein